MSGDNCVVVRVDDISIYTGNSYEVRGCNPLSTPAFPVVNIARKSAFPGPENRP